MLPTLPTMPIQGSKTERKLLKLFKGLDASKQQTLVSFAEFLLTQASEEAKVSLEQEGKETSLTEPLDIERPENESVIKAIKRLSETYPMVNKDNILHPISDLMTAHMLQGKEAEQIIDELEAVFLKEYQGPNN
ncbi:hypothetical protein GCM10009133_19250 [Cocleimonas flava]|uniref:Crp/Fnr family transcriptional regulator n=1 Tax=Cocleimonas flava TaxID=634765 RepID=A0A4R1EY77_9GAMM|nr:MULTISPECIES: hypothetical protein [Cocleimonas]MEB8433829.1 hypothetical protein [Cocleimonas sp. KMM 6892]MEC4716640.1 hypothetical protein [Cocleimonas sp. KMM 6895]MEC4746205.1 hypothetical protein [Cocleimonas sp. KMM 6896]TCJ84849.1 hypothetical protein EV695_2812 [Cocleimonas flava]